MRACPCLAEETQYAFRHAWSGRIRFLHLSIRVAFVPAINVQQTCREKKETKNRNRFVLHSILTLQVCTYQIPTPHWKVTRVWRRPVVKVVLSGTLLHSPLGFAAKLQLSAENEFVLRTRVAEDSRTGGQRDKKCQDYGFAILKQVIFQMWSRNPPVTLMLHWHIKVSSIKYFINSGVNGLLVLLLQQSIPSVWTCAFGGRIVIGH